MNKILTEQIGVYLTPKELEQFEEIRWRERKKKTQIGRDAILEYIKNHGEGNNTFKIEDFQDPNFIPMPATMSPTPKWNDYVRRHMDRKERMKLDKQLDFIRMTIKSQNHMEDMNKNGN